MRINCFDFSGQDKEEDKDYADGVEDDDDEPLEWTEEKQDNRMRTQTGGETEQAKHGGPTSRWAVLSRLHTTKLQAVATGSQPV